MIVIRVMMLVVPVIINCNESGTDDVDAVCVHSWISVHHLALIVLVTWRSGTRTSSWSILKRPIRRNTGL